ncbi:MAG: hypothetical protein KDD69_17425 [Bdellovibrionales bacterium]|nr:hypothetical protein [Bdellovibrionales bacterium]
MRKRAGPFEIERREAASSCGTSFDDHGPASKERPHPKDPRALSTDEELEAEGAPSLQSDAEFLLSLAHPPSISNPSLRSHHGRTTVSAVEISEGGGQVIAFKGTPRTRSATALKKDTSALGPSEEATNVVSLSNHRRVVALQTREQESFERSDVPLRNYDCPNYSTCLGIAAALDWSSFSCKGCVGRVNKQLLWRAHQMVRSNRSLQQVCGLPVLWEDRGHTNATRSKSAPEQS